MQNTEIKGNRDCRKTDYQKDCQGMATRVWKQPSLTELCDVTSLTCRVFISR